MLGAGELGRPRGMEWGGRREEGSGWGTHVYLWWIHFDIWQNQYNIVKFKNKIKFKKKTTHHSENQDHDILSHHFMANRWGNNGNSERLYILGLQNHCGR